MPIHVRVTGEPGCKERPRVGKTGTYTPAKTKAAEEAIGWAVKQKYPGFEPLSRDVMVMLHFNTDSPSKDIDNMTKLVLDALNGVVWKDDRQVTSVCAYLMRKRGKPKTDIVIQWWGDPGDDDDD